MHYLPVIIAIRLASYRPRRRWIQSFRELRNAVNVIATPLCFGNERMPEARPRGLTHARSCTPVIPRTCRLGFSPSFRDALGGAGLITGDTCLSLCGPRASGESLARAYVHSHLPIYIFISAVFRRCSYLRVSHVERAAFHSALCPRDGRAEKTRFSIFLSPSSLCLRTWRHREKNEFQEHLIVSREALSAARASQHPQSPSPSGKGDPRVAGKRERRGDRDR